jgi:flagellar hook-associated protein 3 FlgL
MIFEAARLQTAAARDAMMDAQRMVTTGKRVDHPGDDPGVVGSIISHSMSAERFDTINQAVGRASDEAQLADGALQGVSTLLARARELAVQLGNDTYSSSERSAGAQEIRDISSQIVVLMNTQEGGRYVFGGNVDHTPPFDAAGNYSGDANTRQVEVAPGLLQNASVRADVALKGVGGGVDVFASLATLATAMTNGDGAGIRAAIDPIATSTDQVAAALTQNGGILDGFQSAGSIGSVAKEAATKLLAAVSEVDIFEATSKLTQAQQGLEGSLAVAAKSFNFSLLDFLAK